MSVSVARVVTMKRKFSELRQKLLRSESVRSNLIEVLDSKDSLKQRVKDNLQSLEKMAILRELENLPIEKLRDASATSIRIEYLKRSGFENMKQVFESPVSRLAAVNGVSPEVAREISLIATKMYEAIQETISIGIDPELTLSEEEDLVRSLDELDQLNQDLLPIESEVSKLLPILDDAHQYAAVTSRRIRWWFHHREGKEKASAAIDLALYSIGLPGGALALSAVDAAITRLKKPKATTSSVREVFEGRSGDFYALLEEVQDRPQNKAQFSHFSQELIDEIESTEFDSNRIKATMRKYQVFGTKFALTQKRVILGDEMGLGKTMQALGVLSEREKCGATRFLIVVPASVIINWTREILDRTSLTPLKIHGDSAKTTLEHWISSGGLAITTFDTLKSFSLSDEEIAKIDVDTLIVDEAHFAKNLGTGRSREVRRWSALSEYVIFLTGTPMENRVEEFLGLVGVINPEIASQLDSAILAAGPDPFKVAVAPVYLRRNVAEVLKELPELIEKDELCDWTGVSKDFYEQAVRTGNFMAMRRAAFVPMEGFRPSKMERLIELVDEAHQAGQKVIVYSFFRSVISYVSLELGDKAYEPITGDLSPKKRQELVDSFSSSKTPKVLIGQIQAAGTGLNIQSASVVILCEPQIKPTLETQAIARAHRMGQVRKVRVHRLIVENSIDSGMRIMLQRKTEEFDSYARESVLAGGIKNPGEENEESIAKEIIRAEQERLGLKPSESGSDGHFGD
jgi:SNF2 family DNA or RNA helicase